MRQMRYVVVGGVAALLLAGFLGGAAGCSGVVFRNLTKERTGNINVQFINNTPYRAAFSFGTWDAWDNTPGPVTLQQLRLEPNTASGAAQLPCRRNAAVGTQALVDRALETKADQVNNFDADAFDVVVRFSSGPIGSGTAGLPVQGTAVGVEKLLGIDYSCGDRLIFTFQEDPDAEGGFRIDYEVILDKPLGE